MDFEQFLSDVLFCVLCFKGSYFVDANIGILFRIFMLFSTLIAIEDYDFTRVDGMGCYESSRGHGVEQIQAACLSVW